MYLSQYWLAIQCNNHVNVGQWSAMLLWCINDGHYAEIRVSQLYYSKPWSPILMRYDDC